MEKAAIRSSRADRHNAQATAPLFMTARLA
ncbi:hypothetical protein U713_17005 [Rhodobacter capsulatus YW2]|nr:hypothetical protein U713_17005 [Rhodobacter capsulatus YW2]